MPELPNIVRERLKASRPSTAHPDPDVLTAFAERSLPESERAVVMEHVSRCHDCRDILALALPATVTVETVRVPLPVHRGWLRAPVLRWGVVAAGLAVFAVTGMLQYQSWHRSASYIAAKQESAPVPVAASTQTSGGVDTAKPMPGTPKASVGSGEDFGNAASASPSPVNANPAEASNTVAASTNDRSAAMSVNEPVVPSAPGAMSSPRLSTSLAASSAGRATGSGSIGGALKQSPQVSQPAANSSAVTVEVSAEAPLVATNVADQAAGKPVQYEAKAQEKDQIHGATGQRAFFDPPVDKAKAPAGGAGQSYDGPVPSALAQGPRWAISTTGSLLRSFDQGRTWAIVDVSMSQSVSTVSAMEVATQNNKYQQAAQDTRQLQAQSQPAQSHGQSQTLSKNQVVSRQKAAELAGSAPVFRAVSAAGLQVWAGGTAGLLYHSADGGQQWTRVFLMTSGGPSTGDIIGIAFPDPQHGQITTSTQELWITLDAGQTWQKQ